MRPAAHIFPSPRKAEEKVKRTCPEICRITVLMKSAARRPNGRRAALFPESSGQKMKPHTSAHSDGTFGTIYRVRWWGRQNSNL